LKILSVSGSTRKESSNTKLLEAIHKHFGLKGNVYSGLLELPLFDPAIDVHPWPSSILAWRTAVRDADAVIISTPVYLFNFPAVLKNALEWLTTSGELDGKPLLAITYTPYPPRGEKAMQSLLWSLTALNARVVASLPLYKTELEINDLGELKGDDSIELLEEALNLFKS